jgi:putative spermidine/putrescine transport system ATP-binding protein
MDFLSARNIRKAYGGIVAVDDVSFDVEEGELVTLLGPSGSGKTTVLMCIAGFVDPDGGDIALRGRSVVDLPPHKRNIGMMFQQYALFPHMTVLDNVAYPLTVRRVGIKERTAAVMEALALVKLAGMEKRYPKELSGGQQQRVALARALVFKPPILLMDEPLGALDRKLRAEMQMEIRAIQRKVGITTLYVTHDQEEALTISDRIGVMHEGRLVQIGRPMEMYDRPVDIFVADFLGEANILHGRVVAGNSHVITIDSGGLRVSVDHSATSHAAGDEAVVAIRPERIRLATGRDGWQHAEGVIEQVLYLGNQFRMVVNIGGKRITALMGRDEVAAVPESGARVTLEWSPAAPILLRSSQPDPRQAGA